MLFFKKVKYNKIIKEAICLKDEGKYFDAIAKYKEAFEILINLRDYFVMACLYVELKEYDKAIKVFNEIIEHCTLTSKFDCISDVYFGLGVCHDSLKQNQMAIDNYELAIKYGCSDPECYYFCANLYDEMDLEENDPLTQKAIAYYKKTLELFPEHLFSIVSLGNIYGRFKSDQISLEYFLKAKELDKNNIACCNYNLGVAYNALGDYEKAEYYYLEELKQENPFSSTNYNLGYLYRDMKKYDLSIKYYLKAIELNKEDYNAWYNLGCMYAVINDFDNAFECFTYIKYNKFDFIQTMIDDNELVELRKDKRYKILLDEKQ